MDRQPRLADAASTAQRQCAHVACEPANLAQLMFAADKGIKLLAGITLNTQFHTAARLPARGISRSYVRDHLSVVAKVTRDGPKRNLNSRKSTMSGTRVIVSSAAAAGRRSRAPVADQMSVWPLARCSSASRNRLRSIPPP